MIGFGFQINEIFDTISTIFSYLFIVYIDIVMFMMILSVNKICFGFIIKEAEFWVKLFAVLQFMILYTINFFIYCTDDSNDNDCSGVFGFTFTYPPLLLVVIITSSFDALKIRFSIKIIFAIIMVILLCYSTVWFNLSAYNAYDAIINIKSIDSTISLFLLMSDSLQIILI